MVSKGVRLWVLRYLGWAEGGGLDLRMAHCDVELPYRTTLTIGLDALQDERRYSRSTAPLVVVSAAGSGTMMLTVSICILFKRNETVCKAVASVVFLVLVITCADFGRVFKLEDKLERKLVWLVKPSR